MRHDNKESKQQDNCVNTKALIMSLSCFQSKLHFQVVLSMVIKRCISSVLHSLNKLAHKSSNLRRLKIAYDLLSGVLSWPG